MRIFHSTRTVALPALLAPLALAGCESTSGLDVVKDVGMSVVVEIAAGVVADCNDYHQPNNRSICEEQTDAVVKLGQSLHSELTPAYDSPSADELSEHLDTFIEQRRMPAVGNLDETDGNLMTAATGGGYSK